MKIKISIIDDNGDSYEKELELEKNKKTLKKKTQKDQEGKKISIRSGSTSNKILDLIKDGFFDKNRTISDIVNELETHDYHFKSTDLTLPLRTLVRSKMLKKTKELPDKTLSKLWTYIKW